MQLLSASYGIQSRMSISPVDWIWYPNEGFYSSQCAQYYGSSRRFDQKGSNPDYSRRRAAYQEGGGCSASSWADVGFGCRSQSKPWGAPTHHGKGYACPAQPVTGW